MKATLLTSQIFCQADLASEQENVCIAMLPCGLIWFPRIFICGAHRFAPSSCSETATNSPPACKSTTASCARDLNSCGKLRPRLLLHNPVCSEAAATSSSNLFFEACALHSFMNRVRPELGQSLLVKFLKVMHFGKLFLPDYFHQGRFFVFDGDYRPGSSDMLPSCTR